MSESLQSLFSANAGGLLLLLVFVLLALRVPIGVALGLPSLVVSFVVGGSVSGLATAVVGAMNDKFLLTAIPFFVLSSVFLAGGGVAERIVRFAVSAVGHLRGGLASAGVFACMLFAALSGSSPATVAAIGPMALRGMERARYPQRLAVGVISTAGTLGILIPPSIVMVVYAAATNESVGRLFIAGIVPGLTAGLLLMLGVRVAVRNMRITPSPKASMRVVLDNAGTAAFGLLLIVLILTGIYAGWFTPTEAAAFAAVYGFVVASCVYRGMGFLRGVPWRRDFEPLARASARAVWQVPWAVSCGLFHRDTRQSLIEAVRISLMLMFIIFNALMFSHVLTELQLPQRLTEGIAATSMPPWLFLLCVNALLLIGGQFMEPSGLLLIVAPIVHPIALSLGIDPIHLGIVMVVNMEIGMITPPVGLNLFVASSIANMSVLAVVRAVLPWMLLLLLFLLVVTYLPFLSTALPNALYGAAIR